LDFSDLGDESLIAAPQKDAEIKAQRLLRENSAISLSCYNANNLK
jgi:hypothetical protein